MSHIITLEKESFKFSSAHFTIHDDNAAERLHGHNYRVAVELAFEKLDSLGMAVEFNLVKKAIKDLTDRWDERILIPSRSPHITRKKIEIDGLSHLQVQYQNRTYMFPEDEVCLIDTTNITTEELARVFTTDLQSSLSFAGSMTWIQGTVFETDGQGARYRMDLKRVQK